MSHQQQLITQSSLGRGDSTASLSHLDMDDEKVWSETWAGKRPERPVQDFLQHSGVETMDEHLVEFSEALRTVAKAMRRVSEGKARAQQEAAEWQRKYELEKMRNALLEKKGSEQTNARPKQSFDLTKLSENGVQNFDRNSLCHEIKGICSEEVLLRNAQALGLEKTTTSTSTCKSQFSLTWGNCGKSKRHKHDVVSFESGNITTAVHSSKQITLEWESPPQSVVILTKPNSTSVRETCKEMIRWLKEEKKVNIYVEGHVKGELLEHSEYYSFVQTWEKDEVASLHEKIDIVITLGGDGTILWAASMFKGPVPPIVPFSLGSLGFMTPFQSEMYKEYLEMVMTGPFSITLRHRLQCRIIRDESTDDRPLEEPILVLNDVAIDRGMSSYLTYLECYCDNSFVTCVQGDGLILSTTSGSTAYSLAAGGSVVHPEVPGILFTPICPHSLSFRPLILPQYVTLRIQVPYNSRGQAWASFDGKGRVRLNAGDALLCTMAPWPVPTACQVDSTHDFLRSVCEGLHWNLRKKQSFDGVKES
eukprot:TRINITY_DN8302_c0_g1_i1.p1 TRINITY_DN8302_c0_g1~~TRINITY_DN8302_c0_g1_i1.p1  ORF type:complete len:534 (+),score=96.31 TRINITY_DN8302_c0_g1_i1:449-2050(+)